MGKVAFVFPGQGAQYSGMGRDLCENVSAASEIFALADTLRPGTSAQCFTASDDELKETNNAQPCIMAVELAAAAAVIKAGIVPDMVAGFSLGELSALAFSKTLDLEEGFRLVCLRGELMQADAEKFDSGMAAVLKLDSETVEKLCSGYEHVYPVNYNCPGQISVSGLKTELDDFVKSVKAAGGRAIPLKVKGGFHSPFMADASRKFGEALQNSDFHKPTLTVYSDYTGKPYGDDAAVLLERQICSPVRWQDIITDMIRNGVDTFIEVGPGKTLCGLIAKTDSTVRTFNIEDCESLERTVREVSAC